MSLPATHENLMSLSAEQIQRLQRSHDRYEYVRRLNPRQFAELYRVNIRGGVAFDDLVDQRIQEGKLK